MEARQEAKELTITIRGEDRTYKQKFLIYEPITLSDQDPTIQKCLQEALSAAKIVPEDIKIRTVMQV
jgi:hypothetical protein